jgi:hypothetical protein
VRRERHDVVTVLPVEPPRPDLRLDDQDAQLPRLERLVKLQLCFVRSTPGDLFRAGDRLRQLVALGVHVTPDDRWPVVRDE